jgi:Rps23 Pro-64 3,4-dihydroxylase Tpa1-like proline 4-hydroxylase
MEKLVEIFGRRKESSITTTPNPLKNWGPESGGRRARWDTKGRNFLNEY